jgi:hypothetical protein
LVAATMFVYILLRFAVDRALPRSLAVIVDLLAFRQGDLALDQVFFQINPGGNQRESLLLNTPRQFIKFLPVEK